MAIDQRTDASFLPGPPPTTDLDEDPTVVARTPSIAPLRPMERAWMLTWQTRLDPRVHAAVPDTSMVSTLVRERAGASSSPGWRYLAPAGPRGAVADVLLVNLPRSGRTTHTSPARPTDRPAPRSMGVQPMLAYGLSRRTAELLAVLSACLDPAERRPDGHAVRVAYLASRIASELEMGDDARSDLLYAGLLRDAGSTGLEAADHADSVDVEQRHRARPRRTSAAAPTATPGDARHLSRPDRAAAMVRVLGLPQGVLEAVASAEERWDGRGPRHEKRTAVPAGARVLALAAIAAEAAAARDATPASIEKALRRERGNILDPDLVDSVLTLGRGGLWAELGTGSLVERLLELEPLHRVRHTDDAGLDAIAGAFADLVDTRTPAMGRHGRRVADFAARTSVALGLEPRVAADVRRAALLHDIGKLLVPISFLEKPEALSDHERRVVAEHARAGAAVLERSRVLGGLAPLIAAHHERLDGTGLFPAMVDDDRELGARIIALCDRFEAMTADRPYRPALFPGQAWAELRDAATDPLAGVVLRIMERTISDR